MADHPAVWRLLRLLQGDFLQGRPHAAPGQPSRPEEERSGRGEDRDAGFLQPEQQQHSPANVHSHAGGGAHAGEGKPTDCLGTRPFTGGLCRRSHDLWDVQIVGLLYEHMDGPKLKNGIKQKAWKETKTSF